MKKISKVLLSTFIVLTVVCYFNVVHADLIFPRELPGGAENEVATEESEVEEEGEVGTLVSELEDEGETEVEPRQLIAPSEETEEGALIGPTEEEATSADVTIRNCIVIAIAIVVLVILIFIANANGKRQEELRNEVAYGAKPEEKEEVETEEKVEQEEKEENKNEEN